MKYLVGDLVTIQSDYHGKKYVNKKAVIKKITNKPEECSENRLNCSCSTYYEVECLGDTLTDYAEKELNK